MEADQRMTYRTNSTDPLHLSIESTNWLLDCGIATVGTLQKERNGIPSDLLTPKIERLLVELAILERRRRTFS